MKSVTESTKPAQAFTPAAKTSTVTGTAVDRLGFNTATFYVQVGAVSGTTPTLDFKVQHATDSAFTTPIDVSGATLAQITDGTHEKTITVDLRPLNRYIRILGTIAGTSPSFLLAGAFILGNPSVLPTTQPTT